MSIIKEIKISLISMNSLFLLLSIILINNTINNSALAIKSNNDLLFSPNFIPYGSKYESWVTKWSQWSYSMSINSHPAFDYTGKLCSQNQTEHVWFLVGTFGYPVIRECTIPAGTAILFPILNTICTYAEYPNLKTEEQLRECASDIQNHTADLNFIIDGKKLIDIETYRLQSSLFNLTLPIDNVLNVDPQFTKAVSDGYWIFLKPLTIGKHEIRFYGNVNFINNTFSFSKPNGWNYETIYNLTIVSEPLPSSNVSINHIDIQNHLNKIRENMSSYHIKYIELSDLQIKNNLKQLSGWNAKNNVLHKTFKFEDYATMFSFAFKVSEISQIINHHPNITAAWDTITLASTTWSTGNTITNQDFNFAKYVEEAYQKIFNNSLISRDALH
jgi:pterin-4a-carbinolamine dehydratase